MSDDDDRVVDFEKKRRLREGSSNGSDGGDWRYEFGQRLTRVETKVDSLEKSINDLPTKAELKSEINSLKVWVLLGVLAAFVLAAGFGIGIAELLVSSPKE